MDTTFAKNQNRNSFSWVSVPIYARLFNPDLPLSMETGIELWVYILLTQI